MAPSSCQRVSSPPYGRDSPLPAIADYQSARTNRSTMLPHTDANPLLKTFVSDPEQAVIGFSLDGAIFLWNQAAENLYGFTEAEVLGKSMACLLPLHELRTHGALLKNPSSTALRVDAMAERLNRAGLRISVRVQRFDASSSGMHAFSPGCKLLPGWVLFA